MAQDGLYIPTFVYRTGAFAPSGIPIADGFKDYFTLLNERDGGIEGVKVVHEECETNYDTKVGVECYERLKSKGPLMINPLLHRHHLRADPQGAGRQDPDPVDGLRPHGRSGRFGARLGIQCARRATGARRPRRSSTSPPRKAASTNSRARRSPTFSTTAPTARSRFPTLEALSKKHGFELELLAVDIPGQEQKATWLEGAPGRARIGSRSGVGA